MALVFWHWLTLGVVLIAVEIVAPGAFLLFPGMAALVTGVIVCTVPGLEWETQALIFALASVAALAAGRRFYFRLRLPPDRAAPNRRAEHLVGCVHPLTAAIVGGRGRVKVGDASWLVAGPDLPAGALVRVTGAVGTVLRVEPAGDGDG